MGLVQTAFLAGLAAVAIPVIVHLIFHWQTRHVELGTVRFLADIIRENTRRKRLKRWLLLLLRTAGIALLVLAFARPYLLARQESGRGAMMAILIDRSGSMGLTSNGSRLVDQAVERAREIVRHASDHADIEVALFDHRVVPLPSAQSDESEDRSVLEDLLEFTPDARLESGTSYGAALSWARDLCLKAPEHNRDVYLLSDLQRAGLDWAPAAPFPHGVRVQIEDFGRDQVNNVALLNAAPSSTTVRPGEAVTCRVTLFNFGPFELPDVPLLLTLSSGSRTHRLRQSVLAPPDEAVEVEFAVPALAEGFWEGTVLIDAEDDLAFDNVRHIAVLSQPQFDVLLVDGGDGSDPTATETLMLEAALRLAPPGKTWADTPFSTHTVYYGSVGSLPALDNFDFVVLADAPLSAFDAERLASFVKSGGGTVIFNGDRMTPGPSGPLSDAGLLPGTMEVNVRSNDLPFRWQQWDVDHSLFDVFADPQSGDLRRLSFSSYVRIQPSPGTTVLAEFSGGDPALTEHSLGAGRVLWFAAGCGRSSGEWTRSRLFLPVVHQMLSDLAGLTGGGPVRYTLLEREPLIPASERAAGPMTDPALSEADAEDRRPGVFERNGYREVINVSGRESDPERCTPEEFAQRFQFELEDDGQEGIVATSVATQGPSGFELRADEVWYWFVCAALMLLLIEWFVANRTPA